MDVLTPSAPFSLMTELRNGGIVLGLGCPRDLVPPLEPFLKVPRDEAWDEHQEARDLYLL
jgi:hypothetical protein